jgi:hypothetical protein
MDDDDVFDDVCDGTGKLTRNNPKRFCLQIGR